MNLLDDSCCLVARERNFGTFMLSSVAEKLIKLWSCRMLMLFYWKRIVGLYITLEAAAFFFSVN